MDPQLIFHFQQSLDKSPNNPGTSVSTETAGTWTMLRDLESRTVPSQEIRCFEEQERKAVYEGETCRREPAVQEG